MGSRVGVSAAALIGLALAAASCGGGGSQPHPESPLPEQSGWWRDRVFYEVFVRSFADSDGDGRGDLAGLTAKLDVLNDGIDGNDADLGVGALWLMPVFRSPSYHGYDVYDYRSINPQYGTLDDFDALLAAAHARGMKVILDFVPNHTSSAHPWFEDSRSGPSAAKRDWYQWRSTNPGWVRPWDGGGPTWHAWGGSYYYGVFTSSMPDLNLRNAAVEAELLDAMRFWLSRGVDGFRLDAVRYLMEGDEGQADLPETHAFLHRMRRTLQLEFPEVLLVGEAWTGASTVATYYGTGEELQLAFGFDLAEGLKDAVVDGASAPLLTALGATRAALEGKDRGFDAPFLSNHDMPRVMRVFGGDAAGARLAAALLLSLPGTPFLYYGEELGMQGGADADDRNKRTPMRWDAALPNLGFTTGTPWFSAAEGDGVDVATQQLDEGSLWRHYQRLIALRGAEPGLRQPALAYPPRTGGGAGVLAFVRGDAGARVLVLANLAAAPSGPFSLNLQGTPDVLLSEGLTGTPSPAGDALEVEDLAPRGFAFIALD